MGVVVNPLYGCVVVAQVAAQAGVRLRPHLADVPIVVMEGVRPMERAFGLNAKARAMGLKAGMSLVEVETFGKVAILARSVSEERSAHAILLQAMRAFSPRIEARVCEADWECVVDLAGTERLLGDGLAVSRQIVARLAAIGFSGFCWVAGNVDAGLSVARFGAWSGIEENGDSLPQATLTVSPQQVPGMTWQRTEHELKTGHVLAGLPLCVLRLDEETAERFAVWGIETLGELAALPETALVVRMGQAGKQLRMRARGELPHLLEPVEEEFQLAEEMELAEPVERLEPLLFVLNPMLEQLTVRARERSLALASVTVSFGIELAKDREQGKGEEGRGTARTRTESDPSASPRDDKKIGSRDDKKNGSRDDHEIGLADGKTDAQTAEFVRTVRPAVATLDRRLLLKMLQLDLEAHPAPGAVVRVRMSAEPGDASRIQLGLFAPPMPEPTRFEDTHARLVSIVGEGNVGRVKLLDTYAPDDFRLERFVLPGSGSMAPPTRVEGARPATAMRRMRPALEVRVLWRGGEMTGFWFEGRRYEVLRRYGPWRTSGDWWGGSVWSLDTWDLVVRDVVEGELMVCLLGHDLLRDVWELEGVYD